MNQLFKQSLITTLTINKPREREVKRERKSRTARRDSRDKSQRCVKSTASAAAAKRQINIGSIMAVVSSSLRVILNKLCCLYLSFCHRPRHPGCKTLSNFYLPYNCMLSTLPDTNSYTNFGYYGSKVIIVPLIIEFLERVKNDDLLIKFSCLLRSKSHLYRLIPG